MAKGAVLSAALAVACFTVGRAQPERVRDQRGAFESALRPAVRLAHGALSTIERSAHASPASLPRSPQPRNRTASCPREMVMVQRPQGAFCIDRWEASVERLLPGGAREPWPGNHVLPEKNVPMAAVSVSGRKPQGYISGAEAARACQNAEKRLCEIDEWVRACRGNSAKTYPYGNERQAGVCNDRYKVLDAHPVQSLFDQEAPSGADRHSMWLPKWMNDPRLHEMRHSVEPTGSRPGCVSEAGAYDLVGNLHEWVADPEGTFVGGFFMDTYQNGEGCGYRTRAHDFEYHDYSTGFRCCRDAM